MKVGCVKEIKNNEFRVGMTPDNAKSYVNAGHDVYIEKGAGEGSGFLDAEYEAAGAKMIDTAKEVWDTVEMMIKVKAASGRVSIIPRRTYPLYISSPCSRQAADRCSA